VADRRPLVADVHFRPSMLWLRYTVGMVRFRLDNSPRSLTAGQSESFTVMRPKLISFATLAAALAWAGHAALAGNIMFGPGPGLTGNDTGGIIMYAPGLNRGAYHQLAANWCARWGRLPHLTSIHRVYGDYVGFVCIDRPWMIH
jgi:hypothetical protein